MPNNQDFHHREWSPHCFHHAIFQQTILCHKISLNDAQPFMILLAIQYPSPILCNHDLSMLLIYRRSLNIVRSTTSTSILLYTIANVGPQYKISPQHLSALHDVDLPYKNRMKCFNIGPQYKISLTLHLPYLYIALIYKISFDTRYSSKISFKKGPH